MENTALTKLQRLVDHVKVAAVLRRHFENFWVILFLRLGLIRLSYFLYRIHNNGRTYSMLARPTTSIAGDIFVLREVLVEETYKDALALLKGRNIRLVDIGANLGSFTIWANSILGVREAFCFEPEPDSFRLLQFNLYRNGCAAAKALDCAVGGAPRTIKMAGGHSSPAGANIYGADNSDNTTSVEVISLEKWLCQIEGRFDLLKMDCEGAEWEIIRQTDPQQFARFHVVVVEVHPDPENKQAIPEFKPSLERLGFRTIRWDNKSHGLYVGIRDNAPG